MEREPNFYDQHIVKRVLERVVDIELERGPQAEFKQSKIGLALPDLRPQGIAYALDFLHRRWFFVEELGGGDGDMLWFVNDVGRQHALSQRRQ